MDKIQETVNIVEKLTTAYYAALGLIFAIFLGVIVFLILFHNSTLSLQCYWSFSKDSITLHNVHGRKSV